MDNGSKFGIRNALNYKSVRNHVWRIPGLKERHGRNCQVVTNSQRFSTKYNIFPWAKEGEGGGVGGVGRPPKKGQIGGQILYISYIKC